MSFTFIMLIGPQTFFPALAALRIALLAAAIATAAYLWDRLVRHRPIIVWSRETGLAVCLAGWAVVTVPLSYSTEESISLFLNLYAKSLMIFWLLSNVTESPKRLHQTFWALSLMAIPMAATGVEHFFSGTFLDIEQTRVQRIQGYEAALTGNPNDLALMLNLILPLSVALLLIHRRPAIRVLLLGGICLSVAAVIVTFSRTGFLTLATLLFLYVWKLRRRPERRWTWAVVVFLTICIPLAGPSYMDRLATIARIEGDVTGSAQQRWSDMMAAVRFTLGHPMIGAGIGQNPAALAEEEGASGGFVHNVYLEYAVDLGIPGLVLFLMLLIACIKSVVFVQRETAQEPALRELFYLAEALQLSLLAFAVSALFHPVAYHFYFYYMAGLALAAKILWRSERQRWTSTKSNS